MHILIAKFGLVLFLPNEARIKDKYLAEYYNRNKKPLLIDYMEKEILKRVNESITRIQ